MAILLKACKPDNWAIPWKSGHESLKKIFAIDLIFIYIYYASYTSVISFEKNLSYQQINKLIRCISLQSRNFPKSAYMKLKILNFFLCISMKFFLAFIEIKQRID